MSKVMDTIIIADVHLKFKDNRANNIVKFLKEVVPEYKRLIIAGDFFEFWYGFDRVIISDYFYVLYEFKKLIEQGVEIIYIEGNHDFCMGQIFYEIGVKVYKEFYNLKVNNKKFLIMHGDTINLKNDRFYAMLRKFLRSRFTNFLMNILPVNLIINIAEKFSNTSRKYFYKNYKFEKIFENFIKNHTGYDYYIAGHYHKNFNYKNFYLIGDWSEEFNYIKINKNGNLIQCSN